MFVIVGLETWRLLDKHGRNLQEWPIGIGIVVCFAQYVFDILIVCECPKIVNSGTAEYVAYASEDVLSKLWAFFQILLRKVSQLSPTLFMTRTAAVSSARGIVRAQVSTKR